MSNTLSNLANAPTSTGILCENCGYALNGLPASSNCPECGLSIADSAPERRGPSDWERNGNLLSRLLNTTSAVLLRPARFYRSLATRLGRRESFRFALLHWGVASLLMGIAAYGHLNRFLFLAMPRSLRPLRVILNTPALGILIYSLLAFVALVVLTRLAGALTSWEASFRGLRLPQQVVLRGLDFHAVHYLPVALLTAITVLAYRWLFARNVITAACDPTYLYILCGEVVIGAFYLFRTYWVGMRNMMYANA